MKNLAPPATARWRGRHLMASIFLRCPLPRRGFISRLARLSAALALAGSGRARAANPRPGSLGVALVGLGYYARHELAPALRLTEHCHLAGVVTRSPEKGLRWAREHGFPEENVYRYDDMARLADNPDIAIVYVVTPHGLHARDTIAAARAGKHVICEKPMAPTVAECDAMLAACRAAGVKLSIGYRLHFSPVHRELARLAREEGPGAFARMTGSHGFTMGAKRPWRAERALAGGGPLLDMGVYCVQAACLAADGAAPVAVTATEHPKRRPDFFVDVEEGLDWTMEFANGARATLRTSFNENASRFRAEVDKGWVELEPAFAYRGLKARSDRGTWDFPEPASQQALQMDDFARCVRERRESAVSGEMGRRDVAVMEAIYESARLGGRRVEVRA
jgi:glucose-fructose oxidoreductase